MFNCTMNWYNIYHIDEFLQYADDFNTPISIQYVEQPSYLNIIKDTQDERIKKIIRRMMIDGEDLINRFYSHVDLYDKMRNNNFKIAFPEWSEILDNELRSKRIL